MSLPYSSIVSVSGVVESPAFTVEKKHMLLAMDNALIPSGEAYLEFSGASAITDFGKYFGQGVMEYPQVQKYFSFLSKGGSAPEKLVVARWYKSAAAAFVKGVEITEPLSDIAAIADGSFGITIGATQAEVQVDFTGATSFSDVATKIQEAMQTDFAGSTCVYNSTTGGLIISGAETGSGATIGLVTAGQTGTDVSMILGLSAGVASQGVAAETYAQFCDRIYQANTAGYSITTCLDLTEADIEPAVQWLQTVLDGQTYNTMVRLVFNIKDLTTAKAISATLAEQSYTGYVITYDPKGEYVNILDCAICASIDYQVANGAINFNFQPAVGYTAITDLGTVVDYQSGRTNVSLMNELSTNFLSCVYSVGFGSQEQSFYGYGLMAGAFGTEDVQVNESALEQNIQLAITNALASLNKIKLQGSDARVLVGSLIAEPLELFKDNGSIARNGTLSNTDRISIVQATGNSAAADAVAENGYYYQIQPITAEDIAKRQIRVIICYLCGGVVNRVRIINHIYGA